MLNRKSTYDNLVNPRSEPKHWGRVILGFLILLASVLLIFLTLSRYFAVSEVELPQLVGLSSEAAVEILSELELEPVLFSEDIANAIVNSVTSQSPEAGEIVRRGRSVAVGVNKPDVRINVPSLIDINQANAQEMLANLGLELDQIDFAFSDAEKGRVIAQEPLAGTVSSDKAGVSIVVSRGPELATFRMPEVRGLTIEEAKQRLQGLGLRKVESIAASVSIENPNVVVGQVPQPGSEVTTGSHVVLNFALSTQTVTPVPQLVGMPLSQVQTQLALSGLSLGPVTYINDPAQAAGIVTYAPSGYTLRGVPVAVTLNQTNLTEPITNLSIAAPAAPTATNPVTNSSGQTSTPAVASPSEARPAVNAGPTITPLPQGSGTANAAVNTNPPAQTNLATVTTPSIDLVDQVATQPSQTAPANLGSQDAFTETENPSAELNAGTAETNSVQADSTEGGRKVPFNFDPASLGVSSLQNQAYRFKLVIDDERGERTALERQMNPGEPVQIDLEVFGEATLQTYINEILFQAWNP